MSMQRCSLVLFLAVLVVGCNPYRRDPGLSLWSPISPYESQVLRQIKKKKDTESYLKYALILSGARTKGQIQPLVKKVKKFIRDVTPLMNAEPDRKKKGKLLLKEMHVRLFRTNLKKPSKKLYRFNQTRIDTLLHQGTFNCMSSAVMYGILAHHFGFKVKGVFIPKHAFIQLDSGDPKQPWEVETTSPWSFARKHDEAYYKKSFKKPPVGAPKDYKALTFADYQKRKIISLLELISTLSVVQHTRKHRMNQFTRLSLREQAGFIDKSMNIQIYRVSSWNNYLFKLLKEKREKEFHILIRIVEKEALNILASTNTLQQGTKDASQLALQLIPFFDYYLESAVKLQKWKKWESAISVISRLRKYIVKKKRAGRVRRSLKYIGYQTWKKLFDEEDNKRAERYLAIMVKLYPSYKTALEGEFWFRKGLALLLQSRYIQSKQAYKRCTEIAPSRKDCQRNLRVAIQNQAVLVQNQKIGLTNRLGKLLQQSKWKKSYRLMKELATLLKSSTRLHRSLKQNVYVDVHNTVSRLAGDLKEKQAVELMNQSMVLLPNRKKGLLGSFYNSLGSELLRQQYYDRAIAAYKKCAKLSTPSYAKVCLSNVSVAEEHRDN